MQSKILYSKSEVMEMLNVSKTVFPNLGISGVSVGARTKYRKKDVDDWIAENRVYNVCSDSIKDPEVTTGILKSILTESSLSFDEVVNLEKRKKPMS